MAYLLSRENEHELCSFCRFSGIIIRGPNCSEKCVIFVVELPHSHHSHRCFPVFGRNINLRMPCSFGMLFTRCSDEVSR